MRKKKESQQRHAKKRFMTRFGIPLTTELHSILVKKIQSNGAVLVEKQSNRVSVFDVPVPPRLVECISNLRVVYDKNTKNIVTTLYEERTPI